MPGVLITEDGDILSISYGPHDQAYDNPHFILIESGDLPPGRFDDSSGTPWYAFILRALGGAKPGVALPLPMRLGMFSRGGGGPSAQSQPPPSSSKDSRQARASAQGGKSGVPARASTRGSRHRRKSCPKGHYWSYKHKKCLKSNF